MKFDSLLVFAVPLSCRGGGARIKHRPSAGKRKENEKILGFRVRTRPPLFDCYSANTVFSSGINWA